MGPPGTATATSTPTATAPAALTPSDPTPSDPAPRGKRPLGSGHIGAALASRSRPVSASRDQLLPVLAPLAPLFPRGGLQRGTVVAVRIGASPAPAGTGDRPACRAGGGITLALALLAQPSTASWCAAVGMTDPGVVAFVELGGDLAHLVLVPRPGPDWAQAAATLLDGMDLVLVTLPGPVPRGRARRLAARARDRRAVLVVLATRAWPEGADVQLMVEAGAWEGVEAGHGHLRRRRAEVLSTGRRAAARPVRVGLWLPGPSGRIEPLDPVPPPGARHGRSHDRSLHEQ